MYDALLFDLDGTLIDTEAVAMRVGMDVFQAMGHAVDLAFMRKLVGIDLPSTAIIIGNAMPNLDQVELNQRWREGFTHAITQDLPLKPGAMELLGARHRPMAIVTSSGREEAHHKLRLAGLSDFFDTVVTLADVAAPKPAPEPYLLAARLLGVPAARCLVFEDSETGSEAAHRAGCIVVQVPDVGEATGRWSHHLATDLLSGARMAGLSL